MENGIYLGLSRQMVLQTNMDIVSNNVANMNTNGFRQQNVLFEEYLSKPRQSGSRDPLVKDPLSFVNDYGQYQSTAPGTQTQTGNSMNVALNGPGFMAVQTPNGQTAYTRDGNFQLLADGTIANSAGYPMLGSGGSIAVPAGSTEVVIDNNGVVSNQNGQIGQIQVAEFDNVQTLKPIGNNLYQTNAPANPATHTKVEQGFLEGSNVNPIVEINRMIEILRDFQSTQNLLDTEHDRLRSAVQKLTQV